MDVGFVIPVLFVILICALIAGARAESDEAPAKRTQPSVTKARRRKPQQARQGANVDLLAQLAEKDRDIERLRVRDQCFTEKFQEYDWRVSDHMNKCSELDTAQSKIKDLGDLLSLQAELRDSTREELEQLLDRKDDQIIYERKQHQQLLKQAERREGDLLAKIEDINRAKARVEDALGAKLSRTRAGGGASGDVCTCGSAVARLQQEAAEMRRTTEALIEEREMAISSAKEKDMGISSLKKRVRAVEKRKKELDKALRVATETRGAVTESSTAFLKSEGQRVRAVEVENTRLRALLEEAQQARDAAITDMSTINTLSEGLAQELRQQLAEIDKLPEGREKWIRRQDAVTSAINKCVDDLRRDVKSYRDQTTALATRLRDYVAYWITNDACDPVMQFFWEQQFTDEFCNSKTSECVIEEMVLFLLNWIFDLKNAPQASSNTNDDLTKPDYTVGAMNEIDLFDPINDFAAGTGQHLLNFDDCDTACNFDGTDYSIGAINDSDLCEPLKGPGNYAKVGERLIARGKLGKKTSDKPIFVCNYCDQRDHLTANCPYLLRCEKCTQIIGDPSHTAACCPHWNDIKNYLGYALTEEQSTEEQYQLREVKVRNAMEMFKSNVRGGFDPSWERDSSTIRDDREVMKENGKRARKGEA